MSNIDQLIIDGVRFPVTTKDRYQCYPEVLKDVEIMSDMSAVEEERGVVQIITWSYDHLDRTAKNDLLRVLRTSGPKTVAYLPDNGVEMRVSDFFVVEIQQPSLQFLDGGQPVWHNLGFRLREVRPHA